MWAMAYLSTNETFAVNYYAQSGTNYAQSGINTSLEWH